MGHINSMNHVINQYLNRYEIQLEPAAKHFNQSAHHGLMDAFTTLNPYAQTVQKAQRFAEILASPPIIHLPIGEADAVNLVELADTARHEQNERIQALEDTLSATESYVNKLRDFTGLTLDLSALQTMAFTHWRSGRMPIVHYLQYEKFLQDDERMLLVVGQRTESFVWGIYLTPLSEADPIDALFNSLGFEPIDIRPAGLSPSPPSGTPSKLIAFWENECETIKEALAKETQNILAGIDINPERLAIACQKVKRLYAGFDVKKFAALSQGRKIFTFTGWMTMQDAKAIATEMAHDQQAIFTILAMDQDIDEPSCAALPPTVLNNPPIIRQFEFFTKLYGLPSYGEIDPTPILAITYTLLFGLMFGDVGHGLVLAFIGIFVSKKFKTPMGGIMIITGVSAIIFGFLYGSIFGFEDSLPALWMRPAENITETLIFAAGLGAGLIALSMLLYMYNAYKQRRLCDLIFGANGACGLVFYSAGIWLGVRVWVFGLPINALVISVVVLPLIFVGFKHPLERYLSGAPVLQNNEGIGQFIFNTIVELFETLLTYLTNTISFVRVGAFAISHAGMMHVVLQLAQSSTGGHNWLILILGNALVILIEGLLVGIQVLRLDFYEMFSRFYTGGGQKFISHRVN